MVSARCRQGKKRVSRLRKRNGLPFAFSTASTFSSITFLIALEEVTWSGVGETSQEGVAPCRRFLVLKLRYPRVSAARPLRRKSAAVRVVA